MDIDLFQSKSGQCGILCIGSFKEPPAGILFDAEVMEMTAEFVNQDPLHFNVTVDYAMLEHLLEIKSIYVGAVFDGIVNETLDTPLFIINDPYAKGETKLDKSAQTLRNIKGFDSFIKSSKFAQAIHREDLEDEDTIQSVMHGADLNSLSYSPHLQRQMKLEVAPQAVATPIVVPQMGLGGGSTATPSPERKPKGPTTDSGDTDDS